MAQEIQKEDVYVTLTNSFVSCLYNKKEFKLKELEVSREDDFNTIVSLWSERLTEMLADVEFEPQLILLLKSQEFIVKNIKEKFGNKEELAKKIASKLPLDESQIKFVNIKKDSYLVTSEEFLKTLLHKFKDYSIKALYDTSLLNSLSYINSSRSLYVDISYGNFDIVLNANNIQKRTFGRFFAKFIEESAKNLHIDFQSGIENLNSFKNIKTFNEILSLNRPGSREIINFINKTSLFIENTLKLFSTYDSIDFIDKIYITGDITKFDFLVNLLSDKLKVETIYLSDVDKSLKYRDYGRVNIAVYENADRAILDMITIPLEGLSYRDGKNEYVFVNNRVKNKKTLTKDEKEKTTISVNTTKKENSFTKDKKTTKTKGKNRDNKEQKPLVDFEKEKPKIIFLAGLVLSLIFYYAYEIISAKEKKFDNSVDNLVTTTKQIDNLKTNLAVKETNIVDKKVDKIFWTKKLLTISQGLSNEIWLSSLSMENFYKTIEDKKVTSKKIVLQGRAYPSSEGHINSIANYMNTLMNSDKDFRKDFISINFEGAKIVNEYGYSVINFKLTCTFSKNVNIEKIEKEDKKINISNPLENIQNIKKNNDLKLKTLETIGK